MRLLERGVRRPLVVIARGCWRRGAPSVDARSSLQSTSRPSPPTSLRFGAVVFGGFRRPRQPTMLVNPTSRQYDPPPGFSQALASDRRLP